MLWLHCVPSRHFFQDLKRKLEDIKGGSSGIVVKKLNNVLERNPGWVTLNNIKEVLMGSSTPELPEGFEPSDIANFRFARICSADVERVFSLYKHVLTEKRRSFTIEHIKHYVVSYVNANTDAVWKLLYLFYWFPPFLTICVKKGSTYTTKLCEKILPRMGKILLNLATSEVHMLHV